MTTLRFRASFLARTGRLIEAWAQVELMLGALAMGERPRGRA